MNDNVITFGCRLNIYESEVIKKALESSGINNVIVFNTCSVTKEAERQAQQAIRKAKREHPHKRIFVTGCAAQINPQKYAAMKEVELVLGNEEKLLPESYLHSAESKILVNDIMSVKETANHLVSSFDGKSRAFIQIQNGCNHRCTFCIIPFGRGNSRSVPIGIIVEQVKLLTSQGYNEIVLTGVDISDYGLDLPGKPSLGQMIKRLLNLVPELKRLRLSSIDVAEIDSELMELIKHEKRIMPHLHISLQAGDNMILKRMKRRHNREQVIRFCEEIRKVRPEAAFGADMIAGFPTETEEMFKNSLDLVKEAKLQYLHVFPYSEREGTPAAKMPQVDKPIRKQRAKLLREEGELQHSIFAKNNIGKKTQIIIENDNIGRTENFLKVELNKKLPAGSLHNVIIKNYIDNKLIAELIDELV
jgi:threonylcarbamoyladenosine tRNA methylthiotransferase MtaB